MATEPKVELHQGDSLVIMDELIATGVKVDCIVTDPPYRVKTGGKNGVKKGSPSGMLTKNKQLMKEIPEFDDWLPKAYKILNDGCHAYFMINMHNLSKLMASVEKAGFYIHNVLVWKKNNATPNKWYMKNCEYVLFCSKGKSKFINNCGSKVVEKFNNPKPKIHPTEKPVDLMKLYVSNSAKAGQTVLDPFMGSGASVVASNELGIDCIGIDNGICEEGIELNGVQIKGLSWIDVTKIRLSCETEIRKKVKC